MSNEEQQKKLGHEGHEHHRDEHKDVFIHIDHKKYDVEKHEMDGKEIRLVAKPPIGPEYNLWLETQGPGDDEIIDDEKHVHIHRGMSFYSVLKQINPGNHHATA
jgi:hypothetical protein